MALTDPFRADVDERIRQSLTHVYSVTAHPVTGDPIELEGVGDSLSFTFDESWTPHIQGGVTVKAPTDQVTLDRLDPRKNCRLVITAGYLYPGNVGDERISLDVHLRARVVKRPDDTMSLDFASDEARAQDAKRRSTDPAPPKTGINEIVSYAAARGLTPAVPAVASDFPPGYGVNAFTELELEVGQDFMSLVTDAAARAGVWVHCEDNGRWRITKRAAVAGVSAHKLYTGPDGTVTSSDTALQREDFYNAVIIKYTWRDTAGAEKVIYGQAHVPGGGAYGVDAIGWVTHSEDRDGPITQAQADTAAQTALTYTITRGRGIRLDAIAAYWLRPGMSVTVQLPAGGQERHIVRAVTFTPAQGSMTLTTRQPENVTTQAGA